MLSCPVSLLLPFDLRYLIWRFSLDSYEAEMGMSGMGLRTPDREWVRWRCHWMVRTHDMQWTHAYCLRVVYVRVTLCNSNLASRGADGSFNGDVSRSSTNLFLFAIDSMQRHVKTRKDVVCCYSAPGSLLPTCCLQRVVDERQVAKTTSIRNIPGCSCCKFCLCRQSSWQCHRLFVKKPQRGIIHSVDVMEISMYAPLSQFEQLEMSVLRIVYTQYMLQTIYHRHLFCNICSEHWLLDQFDIFDFPWDAWT